MVVLPVPRADDRRDLARLNLEADVLQDRLVGGVAEADVLEFDLALECRRAPRAGRSRTRLSISSTS